MVGTFSNRIKKLRREDFSKYKMFVEYIMYPNVRHKYKVKISDDTIEIEKV